MSSNEFTPERYGFTHDEWSKLSADTIERLTGNAHNLHEIEHAPATDKASLSKPKGLKGAIWRAKNIRKR